jgi:SAM-dependent methyltransferase
VSTNGTQTLAVFSARKVGSLKRRTRHVVIARERRYTRTRRRLADAYLAGSGREIGALHMPLRVGSRASVRYVDRFPVAGLREHYPELNGYDLVRPDIIDDGERLSSVADASVDFVIANHMIEHCEDPIRTLENHLRVVRPGGTLYMAVPDGRMTFDRERPVTTLAHVQRDYEEGPQWSRRAHYEEWATYIVGVAPDQVAAAADEIERTGYSIHFHVWTPGAFLELLAFCRGSAGLPFEVEALERNESEFIVVLSRSPGPSREKTLSSR